MAGKFTMLVVAAVAAFGLSAALAASGAAAAGGVGPGSGKAASDRDCKPRLKLRKGRAIAPRCAPRRIKRAVRYANKIRNKPYCYGGGHGRFRDNCYDCSGAVSYLLRGAKAIKRPAPSGALANWGRKGRGGKGKWIRVFAHSGHAYATVGGLRWDTSMTRGDGPGWSRKSRSARGFATRHKRNL